MKNKEINKVFFSSYFSVSDKLKMLQKHMKKKKTKFRKVQSK